MNVTSLLRVVAFLDVLDQQRQQGLALPSPVGGALVDPAASFAQAARTAFHELTAKVHWLLLDHDVKRHDQPAEDGADD